MAKQTPFHDKLVAAGGRMVEFAGFEMPVLFRGIVPEHNRVRTTVGIFDVSHMGRVEIRGPDRLAFVNRLVTNDVSTLAPDQALYAAMCYEDGGIVDDLIVYNLVDYYLLVINAANSAKDLAWMESQRSGQAEIIDVTARTAQPAIQGPRAEAVVQKLVDVDLAPIGYYRGATCRVLGRPGIVTRTGYTGEDGFEVYVPAEGAGAVWDAALDAGREFELEPIGLGARDTLRLEMKYCLYGNDIDQTTNPLEAGLGWITKLDKSDGFIGRDALVAAKAAGITRKLVGFTMTGREIPRPGQKIIAGGAEVGHVTSGTFSPSLRQGIGLGYVAAASSAVDTALEIAVRDVRAPAVVVKTPFYKNASHKK